MKTTLTLHEKLLTIEYEDTPITHKDAWGSCGNGVWVYDSKRNTLFRNAIGSGLPYTYHPEEWEKRAENCHKVLASSEPLWVWWGEGCRNLKWGDLGVALPKLEEHEED